MNTAKRFTRLCGVATAAVIAALLAGCGTTHQTHFLHQNADLGAINKVAVMPFDSLVTDKTAGDKVQKIFYLELLSLDVFEVIEPGQVAKVTRGQDLSFLGPAELQKIGKDLGADALFLGSVVDYSDEHTGNVPTPNVTIVLRLVETQTGSTIWSTSETRSGASAGTRMFGVGGESLTEASRRIVQSQLKTLLK